jgi:hypothetical protein
MDLPELPLDTPAPQASGDPDDLPGAPRRRRHCSRWAVRDINNMLVAKDRSEHRWWVRNDQIIKYLDEGKPVREISTLVGRSERQIRVVREQLNDMRAANEIGQLMMSALSGLCWYLRCSVSRFMSPLHFQTLFLTMIALVWGGYISWTVAQLESP